MKWYQLILIFFSINAQAQFKTFPDSAFIKSYSLEITDNKTTNLIFPAAIKSVDRGSKDVLAQKVIGVENILKIKADVKNFDETNLSVVTTDGKLYSFIIQYKDHPAYQSININETSPVIYSEHEINKTELAQYCYRISDSSSNIHRLKDSHDMVSLALDAIYNSDNFIFCRFVFHNYSSLNYDIDQLRFYIRDHVETRRTASQEIEVRSMYIAGDTLSIRGHSKNILVIAFQKFTIHDQKYFAAEVMEKNGGRNLFLKVRNRQIMKSKFIY